jgi:hypothetical protein
MIGDLGPVGFDLGASHEDFLPLLFCREAFTIMNSKDKLRENHSLSAAGSER